MDVDWNFSDTLELASLIHTLILQMFPHLLTLFAFPHAFSSNSLILAKRVYVGGNADIRGVARGGLDCGGTSLTSVYDYLGISASFSTASL